MFKIKNVSQNDVVLSDLRLVLRPKEIIDLDKVTTRERADMSQSLKLAKSQKKISIVNKDDDRVVENPALDKKALEDMEKRLLLQIKQQLAASKPKAAPEANPEVAALTETIKQLVEQLNNRPQVVQVVSNSPVAEASDSTNDTVDDDKLTKIHAKVVERMSKNVTGNVQHNETVVSDQKLNENISELEDIL